MPDILLALHSHLLTIWIFIVIQDHIAAPMSCRLSINQVLFAFAVTGSSLEDYNFRKKGIFIKKEATSLTASTKEEVC
jgi:hypothetical protein